MQPSYATLYAIILFLFIAPVITYAETRPSAPTLGAIRWDAWTGGQITKAVEKTLAPKKYQHRLPWFAKVNDDNSVSIDGSPQSVMDQDIKFAADAGLDYWAFLIYPKDYGMSFALKQYLKSKDRKRIGFCMMLHNTLRADSPNWPKERDHALSLLKQPGYQTVLNKRPLIYIFSPNNVIHERVVELKHLARKQGSNPYFVYMGWYPPSDADTIKAHKKKVYEATSNYAFDSKQPRFSDLAKQVETGYWQLAAKSQFPHIPLVTTGWDKNPRKDNPVFWEKGHAYHSQKIFPAMARPKEIAGHLSNAIKFIKANPKICQAKSILLYAWNEYDEGGWLAPTLGSNGKPDTSRLDAIARVLKP